MPTRYLSAVIAVFWLGTTTWLFYREVGPRLWPGAPPPYRIDLTDEAQSNIQTQWQIYRNGNHRGYCKTWTRYQENEDIFELGGEFKLWLKERGTQGPDLVIRSSYFVTREGELRGIQAHLTASFFGDWLPGERMVEGQISGDVRGGYFTPVVSLQQPVSYEQALKPVRVSEGGSVLNPLQPLHRLPGLRKGQRWQIRLVDPLTDLANQYIKEATGASAVSEVRLLHAVVSPETHFLRYGKPEEDIPCLVIDYHGEDTSARTWVREKDGLVLKQELTQGNEEMVLVRD